MRAPRSPHAGLRRRAVARRHRLAIAHIRTFCPDPAWPQGDLNLPRAFFTEKAFPENEAVWTMAMTGRRERSVENELIYERPAGCAESDRSGGADRRAAERLGRAGAAALATSRWRSSGRSMPACGGGTSAPPAWKSSCRPATNRAASATATPCSSRSPCGARCCRATASAAARRRRAAVGFEQGAFEKRSCARRSGPPWPATGASAAPGPRRSKCYGPGPSAARRSGTSSRRSR